LFPTRHYSIIIVFIQSARAELKKLFAQFVRREIEWGELMRVKRGSFITVSKCLHGLARAANALLLLFE
jgi:hypothetical protein